MSCIRPRIAEDYHALSTGLGYIPFQRWTRIDVTGNDRLQFLHSFCTNDILGLSPGKGCEAFFTNVQGKVVGHALIYCDDDRLSIETVPGQSDALIGHLDRYLIREDVKFQDYSDDFSHVHLAGPNWRDALAGLADFVPTEGMSHSLCNIAGQRAPLRHVEWTRAESFHLSIPTSALQDVCQCLDQMGARRCDSAALEIARVEWAFPWFGIDITVDNFPQEVDRDRQAISFAKGCYLGQETVARIDALGHVNRTLAQLKILSGDVPDHGVEFVRDEKVVGSVTSSVYSLRLQAPLCLGYVRRDYLTPGTFLDYSHGVAKVIGGPLWRS